MPRLRVDDERRRRNLTLSVAPETSPMLKAVTEVRLVEGERVNEGRMVDRLIEKLYFDSITIFVRNALPGIGYEAPPSVEIKWSSGDRVVTVDEITANAIRLAFHDASGHPDARYDLPFTAAFVADKIIVWLRDGMVIPTSPTATPSNVWDFPMHAPALPINITVLFYNPKVGEPPLALHTTGDLSRPLPTRLSFIIVHDIDGTFHGTVHTISAVGNGLDFVIVARLSDLPIIEA
jgi:hypothetical protein